MLSAKEKVFNHGVCLGWRQTGVHPKSIRSGPYTTEYSTVYLSPYSVRLSENVKEILLKRGPIFPVTAEHFFVRKGLCFRQ